jgi:serine/threonine protein kinase
MPIGITFNNRSIILDWMFAAQLLFKLRSETWFHAVAILDRFIEFHKDDTCIYLSKDNIQKYAIGALSLSSKFYEVYSPEISDYVFVTDGVCTISDVIEAEKEIFRIVGCFNLPNVMEYLRSVSTASTELSYQNHKLTRAFCACYILNVPDTLISVLVTVANKLSSTILTEHFNNPFDIPEKEIEAVYGCMIKRVLVVLNSESVYDEIRKYLLSIDTELLKKVQSIYDHNIITSPDSALKLSKEFSPSKYVGRRTIIEILDKVHVKKVKKLGEGTYGKVIWSKIGDVEFACKKDKMSNNFEGISASFLREVSILQTLSHRNIINMRYVLSGLNTIALDIMDSNLKDYVEGNTLVRNDTEFQYQCAKQLLSGLVYMHDNGIVNRDIKLQNILVKGVWPQLMIKYCDFGGSRGKGIAITDIFGTTEITTLWYRAPELLLGCITYTHAIDIWALMCTFYEVTTAHPLFAGDCEYDQLIKIFQLLGKPTEKSWPGVTNYRDYNKSMPNFRSKIELMKMGLLENVIKSGLVLNPEKRPSSSELLQILRDDRKSKKVNCVAKVNPTNS